MIEMVCIWLRGHAGDRIAESFYTSQWRECLWLPTCLSLASGAFDRDSIEVSSIPYLSSIFEAIAPPTHFL
jgi:hypothetical protein